jgi:hypothetical protein
MYSCVHMYHSRILLDYLTKIEFKICHTGGEGFLNPASELKSDKIREK